MIGKLIYEIGEKVKSFLTKSDIQERWELMAYLYGPPNAGKSTTLDIINALYMSSDIGFIASKKSFEEKFGFAQFLDKFIIVTKVKSKLFT
jgi:phage/plasmid-associated DNA primase